jgi:Cu(I)/Ag(I) efflux system protein CusF
MKALPTVVFASMIGIAATPALAQTAPTTHQATGVVKSVDRAKSAVMLAHDPVKSLNWPAMTMGFTVKEKSLLDKLQPGRKIQFEFVQQGRNYIITSVK